ncbi:hypothetical protein E4U55_004425 [Claviceps digitariae]|nr:hypothetical protein E4U55_004425 [Claviceps digitariae]
MWLDDLFPKAKFLDALAMVEKAGHKKRVATARNELINEGKPKPRERDEEEDLDLELHGDARAVTARDDGGNAASTGRHVDGDRPATPVRDKGGVMDEEEDLYGATPRNGNARPQRRTETEDMVPGEDDDLDALIAEAEGQDGATSAVISQTLLQARAAETGDDDDLDALIAEAEGQDGATSAVTTQALLQARTADTGEEDDLDALIAEAETRDNEVPSRQSAPEDKNGRGGDDFAEEEAAIRDEDGW